jgi:hypothetical protein
MKTPLFTPDSVAGMPQDLTESRQLWRRSPFLYSAALRFGKEPIRLNRTGPDSVATRVQFRRPASDL